MANNHLEKQPLSVPAFDLDTAYHKLSLVSTLLFYMARDELDLSKDALMGMVEIVDDVVETLKPKEEKHHDQREKSIKPEVPTLSAVCEPGGNKEDSTD